MHVKVCVCTQFPHSRDESECPAVFVESVGSLIGPHGKQSLPSYISSEKIYVLECVPTPPPSFSRLGAAAFFRQNMWTGTFVKTSLKAYDSKTIC